jgi:MFS transporter, DHA1 family, tetracycline resistance protein
MFGEYNVVLIGLVTAVIAVLGYGFVGSVALIFALMIVHGPEGFVHPMIVALMSKAVPDDAQGELQGGISSVMNVAMLGGTVFFSQIFGFFWAEGRSFRSPDVAFFVAGALLTAALVLFLVVVRKPAVAPAVAE